jgi:hypothetical protein
MLERRLMNSMGRQDLVAFANSRDLSGECVQMEHMADPRVPHVVGRGGPRGRLRDVDVMWPGLDAFCTFLPLHRSLHSCIVDTLST